MLITESGRMDALERAGFMAHAQTPKFRRRVDEAQKLIAEGLAVGPSFVACSWGKDSIVLVDLIMQLAPETPVLHVRDRYADLITNFSEVSADYRQRFGIANYHEVIVEPGEMSVTEAANAFAVENGYGLRFLGLRLQEEGGRLYSLRQYGPLHQYENGEWRCCPLLHWSWRDVWSHIVSRELAYLELYDLPGQRGRDRSRTTSVYSHRIVTLGSKHGATNLGSMTLLKTLSPKYYALLVAKFPHLARQL